MLICFELTGCAGHWQGQSNQRGIASFLQVDDSWKKVRCYEKHEDINSMAGIVRKFYQSENLESEKLVEYQYSFDKKQAKLTLSLDLSFLNKAKWKSCQKIFSPILRTTQGIEVHVKLMKSSTSVKADSCEEMSSHILMALGIVHNQSQARLLYDQFYEAPLYIVRSCSCSQIDRGYAKYRRCVNFLKEHQDQCPSEGHSYEILYPAYSFKNYQEFSSLKCSDENRKISSAMGASFYVQKNCDKVNKPNHLLDEGFFELLLPKACGLVE